MRLHISLELILVSLYWHLACPMSFSQIEDTRRWDGDFVDQVAIYRWPVRVLVALGKVQRQCKYLLGRSWRIDKTLVAACGRLNSWDRAVVHADDTVDINIVTNIAVVESVKTDSRTGILVCQSKCGNGLIEQDHRAVKWLIKVTRGFVSFLSARIINADLESPCSMQRGK